jgi:hypothetical protein
MARIKAAMMTLGLGLARCKHDYCGGKMLELDAEATPANETSP